MTGHKVTLREPLNKASSRSVAGVAPIFFVIQQQI
jgi:hypothetical protein